MSFTIADAHELCCSLHSREARFADVAYRRSAPRDQRALRQALPACPHTFVLLIERCRCKERNREGANEPQPTCCGGYTIVGTLGQSMSRKRQNVLRYNCSRPNQPALVKRQRARRAPLPLHRGYKRGSRRKLQQAVHARQPSPYSQHGTRGTATPLRIRKGKSVRMTHEVYEYQVPGMHVVFLQAKMHNNGVPVHTTHLQQDTESRS